jgi:hypothetical protein
MRRIRRGAAWSAAWLLSAALYLLLIDITDLPELIVGAAVATLAATGFELAREQHLASERARVRWLRHAHRAVLRAPLDLAIVTLAALRQPARRHRALGEFRAVRFEVEPNESLAAGQAALAETLGSFAPNTIVVGIDHDRGLILGHQLHRTGRGDAVDLLKLGEP